MEPHMSGNINSIQMCGFKKKDFTGGCGRYNGFDLTAEFTTNKVCKQCGQEVKEDK